MNAMLEGKSIPELNAIIEEAKNAKEKKHKMAIKAAYDKLRQNADELGVSIEEILAVGTNKEIKPSKPTKAPVAAKYANPENLNEKWTGRGMTPRWMANAIKLGKKKEDFLIVGSSL